MEIYNLYSGSREMVRWFQGSFNWKILAFCAGIALVLWLPFFILQGIGLCAMAKKRGFKKRALAFIPFANMMYMGKLAGDCNFFGRKMKRAGLYLMLAQIVTCLVTFSLIAAELYLYIACGEPVELLIENGMYQMTKLDWPNLSGFSYGVKVYFELGVYIIPIFELIYKVILFVPLSRFIVIFVVRNRQPIDYEAYVRQKREEFMRRQQQYYNQYGNPYGNPYGRPYNGGYGNPYNNGAPNGNPNQAQGANARKDDDPFAEFSSSNTSSGANGNNNENGGSSTSPNGENDPDSFFD